MSMPETPQQPQDDTNLVVDQASVEVQDPGDAERKGYSADPLQKPPVRYETIPVARDPKGQDTPSGS